MCQDGSIGCMCPLNAISAGGSVPSFHNVRFDFRFCISKEIFFCFSCLGRNIMGKIELLRFRFSDETLNIMKMEYN